jgi:cyanophycinase
VSRRVVRAALAAFALALAAAPQTPLYRDWTFLRGHRQPESRPRAGFALMGGGQDLDSAFQWMCARSGGGMFLVLRASGTAAYNPYIAKLCPRQNAVVTLLIPSRAAAEAPAVAQAIAGASAIFIAGGDQSQYVNFWRGTPVQRALNAAVARGIPIGGTSAGLAVLGEYTYSAQNDRPNGPNLSSVAALANPFQRQVTIVHGFLAIPQLRGLITDTHFHARRRLGRLLVFMARILHDNRLRRIHALGVNQHTAVLVDGAGRGVVAGTGSAYFFAASASANMVCRPGVPLTLRGIAVRRLAAGQRFDLRRWRGGGAAYRLDVLAGRIRSTQPGGSIY